MNPTVSSKKSDDLEIQMNNPNQVNGSLRSKWVKVAMVLLGLSIIQGSFFLLINHGYGKSNRWSKFAEDAQQVAQIVRSKMSGQDANDEILPQVKTYGHEILAMSNDEYRLVRDGDAGGGYFDESGGVEEIEPRMPEPEPEEGFLDLIEDFVQEKKGSGESPKDTKEYVKKELVKKGSNTQNNSSKKGSSKVNQKSQKRYGRTQNQGSIFTKSKKGTKGSGSFTKVSSSRKSLRLRLGTGKPPDKVPDKLQDVKASSPDLDRKVDRTNVMGLQIKLTSAAMVLPSPVGNIDAGYCLGTSGDICRLLPSALIIGAQAAGVFTLHAILNRHQQLVSSPAADNLQFVRKLKKVDDVRKHIQKYYDVLPRISLSDVDHIATFEAPPDYFYSESTAEIMKEFLPNIKIIILLREPGERAYVMFQEACQKGRIGYAPDGNIEFCPHLKTSCTSIIENCNAMNFHNFLFGKDNEEIKSIDQVSGVFRRDILVRGSYDSFLKWWTNDFPKDQIFVTSYEKIAKLELDSMREIHRLLAFLNLKDFQSSLPLILHELSSEIRKSEEQIMEEPIDETTRSKLNKIFCNSNYNLQRRLRKIKNVQMPNYACMSGGT